MKYDCIIIVFATICFVSFGCSNGSTSKSINGRTDSVNVQKARRVSVIAKESDCRGIIRDFLTWYKVHFDALKSIQLVSLIEDSTTAQYRVNFKNTEKYINELRLSGFFSEKYLQNEMRFFKEKDSEFLKEKQSDGPPVGFEADLLLFTQEPESVLEKSNSLKIEKVNPSLLKLTSVENDLLFNIDVQSDKCLIEKIDFSKKTTR